MAALDRFYGTFFTVQTIHMCHVFILLKYLNNNGIINNVASAHANIVKFTVQCFATLKAEA